MKYIKLFEIRKREGLKMYWLLPTDDRFEMSLREIGAPKVFREELVESVKKFYKDYKYAFIGFNGTVRTYTPSSRWGWNPYKGYLYDPGYVDQGYKFYGLVNINDFELEAEKYNL